MIVIYNLPFQMLSVITEIDEPNTLEATPYRNNYLSIGILDAIKI